MVAKDAMTDPPFKVVTITLPAHVGTVSGGVQALLEGLDERFPGYCLWSLMTANGPGLLGGDVLVAVWRKRDA